MSGGTDLHSLKSSPTASFWWNYFLAILFALRVFSRNLLRGSCRRNIFIFSFCCLIWCLNRGLASSKATHYLIDHGEFIPLPSNKLFSGIVIIAVWVGLQMDGDANLNKKYVIISLKITRPNCWELYGIVEFQLFATITTRSDFFFNNLYNPMMQWLVDISVVFSVFSNTGKDKFEVKWRQRLWFKTNAID